MSEEVKSVKTVTIGNPGDPDSWARRQFLKETLAPGQPKPHHTGPIPPDPASKRSRARRTIIQVGINARTSKTVFTLSCGHLEFVNHRGHHGPDYKIRWLGKERVCKLCRHEQYLMDAFSKKGDADD